MTSLLNRYIHHGSGTCEMTSLITQRYLRLTYSANLAARIYIIHTSHLHCGRLIPFSNLARDRIHSSLEKPAPSFCELSLKHTVHNDAQVQYCKCHTQDKYENEQSQLQLLNNVPSMSITTTFTSFYSPVVGYFMYMQVKHECLLG